MNEIKLFNTLSRKKEVFTPLLGNVVNLYACGPTVYNYAHIGNLRTYIFEDVLRRTLEYNGYEVEHVMNITDVGHLTDEANDSGEDKLEKGAVREGKSVWEIAEFYTKHFKKDLDVLNIKHPTIWCKATDYIPEQIDFIKRLEKKGFTYKTSDGVYFDTAKYPEYGALAKLNISGQKEGARVEKNNEKRNPTDFALWKFSPAHEQRQMEWESPWGKGFPGWHIECSAMSVKLLGEQFDIHCGGVDHVPIHHTNERAQNWGAFGHDAPRFWLHGEFLVLNKARMGKSEGNLLTLSSLSEQGFDPLAYRFLTLQTHYRQKLNFSSEALRSAQAAYENLKSAVVVLPSSTDVPDEYDEKFLNAINDDLNMPVALSVVWELLKSSIEPGKKRAAVERWDTVLGLGLASLKSKPIPPNIASLADQRLALKKEKKFEEADDIRRQIEEAGFTVDDTAQGYSIKPKL